jgi:hypothetical protein
MKKFKRGSKFFDLEIREKKNKKMLKKKPRKTYRETKILSK